MRALPSRRFPFFLFFFRSLQGEKAASDPAAFDRQRLAILLHRILEDRRAGSGSQRQEGVGGSRSCHGDTGLNKSFFVFAHRLLCTALRSIYAPGRHPRATRADDRWRVSMLRAGPVATRRDAPLRENSNSLFASPCVSGYLLTTQFGYLASCPLILSGLPAARTGRLSCRSWSCCMYFGVGYSGSGHRGEIQVCWPWNPTY